MDEDQPSCSSTGPKPKKIKKKARSEQHSPTTSSNSNSSPINRSPGEKECQYYAGVGPDSTQLYAKEVNCDDISDDACNLLTEDINYKLRYILHDCLIKGKLQGRENILSSDVEEAFSDLTIDKVYGAPSSPNWQRDGRDNRLHYLEDQKINFIEIAEKEFRYSQEGEFLTDSEWLNQDNESETDMEEYRELFAEYFQTMCEAVVSESEEIRQMALLDISTNPNIGRITDWFYHFSYFLLTKNVTYDHLTMRALHLLETLENSPLSSMHVYGKQLRLLIRLLLQRLLISSANEDVIKCMCYVLSLFCLRPPLKRMVLRKLQGKIVSVEENMTVAFLNIIYYVGIDAIKTVFLPNLFHFLNMEKHNPDLTDVIMESDSSQSSLDGTEADATGNISRDSKPTINFSKTSEKAKINKAVKRKDISQNVERRNEEVYNIMTPLQKDRHEKSQNKPDKFDIMGELVAQKLRGLPTLYAQCTVEHLIHNLLYDAEMGKYNSEPSKPPSSQVQYHSHLNRLNVDTSQYKSDQEREGN
ncbi:hypothetical protein HUJ04_005217 [Dendroctonus ponderosae]|nr:hypothetical protein HUJ04_005217 [Dendroctonus ponderosae]